MSKTSEVKDESYLVRWSFADGYLILGADTLRGGRRRGGMSHFVLAAPRMYLPQPSRHRPPGYMSRVLRPKSA